MDERPPLSATDLLAFTSRDRHSSHLSVPFVLGGHTYGCNGHMATRSGAAYVASLAVVGTKLETVRQALPAGLHRIDRLLGDEPKIVETWL